MPSDQAAVESTGRLRMLLGTQLLALHWPRPGQRRYGESRLRELYHLGWLDRVPLYDRPGPPRALYLLGKKGREYCAAKLGIAVSELGPRPVREREHDLLFLKHHLFAADCVINLQLACERSGGGLAHFEDERTLRAHHLRDRASLPTVPDALVVLNAGGRIQSFCLEADRGTVDLKAWRKKVQGYLQRKRTSTYREHYRAPAVLTIVDSEACAAARRLMELRRVTEDEVSSSRADATLFWFTTSELATREAVLGLPIWTVAGLAEPLTLIPEGS